MALEHCELDEVVTFSDDAINYNQGDTSHIARDYGEQMTMKECLYAVMLESANECAYAVAEHVGQKLGGNYQTFIDLMNQRAKELGCTNTQFTNANGLPDPNHWTSAHDMALISAEAYKNENFRISSEIRKSIQTNPDVGYIQQHYKDYFMSQLIQIKPKMVKLFEDIGYDINNHNKIMSIKPELIRWFFYMNIKTR